MAWRGVVWHGLVLFCMVWHGYVWYGLYVCAHPPACAYAESFLLWKAICAELRRVILAKGEDFKVIFIGRRRPRCAYD